MTRVVSLPCHTEALYLARRALQQQSAPAAVIHSAIETLETSRDWSDRDLARQAREMLRANERIRAAEAARAAGEISERPYLPYATTTAPTGSRHMTTAKISGGIAIAAMAALIAWTAATTSSANAQQQAAIWRSLH